MRRGGRCKTDRYEEEEEEEVNLVPKMEGSVISRQSIHRSINQAINLSIFGSSSTAQHSTTQHSIAWHRALLSSLSLPPSSLCVSLPHCQQQDKTRTSGLRRGEEMHRPCLPLHLHPAPCPLLPAFLPCCTVALLPCC